MKTVKPSTGLTRRSFFTAAGAAGLGSIAGTVAPGGVARAQSADWTQPGNNNHVIALQEQASPPEGPVGIGFYGHCAIKLTSPGGLTLMFDPWRDDPSGAGDSGSSRSFRRQRSTSPCRRTRISTTTRSSDRTRPWCSTGW